MKVLLHDLHWNRHRITQSDTRLPCMGTSRNFTCFFPKRTSWPTVANRTADRVLHLEVVVVLLLLKAQDLSLHGIQQAGGAFTAWLSAPALLKRSI